MFPQNGPCAFFCLADSLGCACVHGCLRFCIPVCVRVCVCLTGNTISALLYKDPKDAGTYQGDISNSCPRRYRFPQRRPSRSIVP